MNRTLRYVVTITTSLAAGAAGGLATAPAIPTWYAGLIKPVFSPPNQIFGPVWTSLYLLMGIAGGKAWNKQSRIRWFFLQLVLNLLWSVLFFGMRDPGAAFSEILVLWYAIVMTIRDFGKKDKTAAILLLPYLMWVTFAAVLNYSVWQLNLKH